MSKKLHISLIFNNLVAIKTLSSNHRMYNLYIKFVKILEICKQFSDNLVNESGFLSSSRLRFLRFTEYILFWHRLHALCGLSGVVHSYDLSKASVADLHYMKDVKHTYHNCSIYGDKGYIGADVQLDLFETAHIRLECPYRLNQKDWKPTFIPFAKARKRIETIFSQLTDQFLAIRNYAKITNGLFARIIGKISALTILQYVNFINNKPIGRIKYALN